jgi:hypothetical protein
MIREIRTAEQLIDLMRSGAGYLYNDFGGRDPKMCLVHAMGCQWIATMIKPPTGRLGVPKLWSDTLAELLAEVERRGKVWRFCGSEPALGRGGPARPPAQAGIQRPPADRTNHCSMAGTRASSHDFQIRCEPGVVVVTCAYRLQFDSKPQTAALKAAIGDAVAALVAGPGQMLEAVYISASRESVDAENVLLYNVGTGRFAATAREGLRFERVFAEPPGSPEIAHLHRYAIVPLDSESQHWRRGRLVVEAAGLRLPRLDAFSKPDAVWLATRQRAPAGAHVHSGPYSLDLTLEVGAGDSVRPADVVKPLIDGLVAGLQAHDGRDRSVVTSRLSRRLSLPTDTVAALLYDETRAWLGRRRLLWPRADGIQWNPSDEDCVSATLRVRPGGGPGWQLGYGLYDVTSLH